MDFGRKVHVDLMASKDPKIKRLIDHGYEFVTNAFEPGSKPSALLIKDAENVASQLRREGYLTELCPAYNEVGDPIPHMHSVWRKRPGAPTT